MQRTLLKSKITLATVTFTKPYDQDCVLLHRELMKKVGLWPYERVEVYNHSNGARFSTVVMSHEVDEEIIVVSGPAAFLAQKDQKITIAAYVEVNESDLASYQQRSVMLGEDNQVDWE